MDSLQKICDENQKSKNNIQSYSCDVTDSAQCESVVGQVVAEHGQVDVLVNVAGGTGPVGVPAWETTPEAFDEIVRLNMAGCFHMMRAVLPSMIARKYGKIVNVGGTFGMHGRAGRMAYSASKWGIIGLMKSAALELGQYGITVNAIVPGLIDTPLTRHRQRSSQAIDDLDNAEPLGKLEAEAKQKLAAKSPLGVPWLPPESIAPAVVFLASDEASMVSGATYDVTGGDSANITA